MNDSELMLLFERERSAEYQRTASRGITRVSVAILLALHLYLGNPAMHDATREAGAPAATSQPVANRPLHFLATSAFGLFGTLVSFFWFFDELRTRARIRGIRRALGRHLGDRSEDLLIRFEAEKYYMSPVTRRIIDTYAATLEPVLWTYLAITLVFLSSIWQH